MQDGQRGHLEGLASVYCELLMAPFGDILAVLEQARQAAWAERSPLHSASQMMGGGASGSTGGSSGGGASGGSGASSGGVLHHRQQHGHRGHSMHGAGLPNSHSQPIYVPGKYSVCINMEPPRNLLFLPPPPTQTIRGPPTKKFQGKYLQNKQFTKFENHNWCWRWKKCLKKNKNDTIKQKQPLGRYCDQIDSKIINKAKCVYNVCVNIFACFWVSSFSRMVVFVIFPCK